MSDANEVAAGADLASHTLVWMRRIDGKLDKILEIMVRHETRITRMERDIGEIKLDLTSFDNRMLSVTTELMRLADDLDGIDQKIDAMNNAIGGLGQKIDRLDARVANIEGKLDISARSPS